MSTPAPQDRYRRLDLLGRGGMGEVFLAEDVLLRRKVAIKVVHRSALENPRAEKLLRREAEAAAALDNPFICKVYEVGEVEGRVFVAMEYVQGETLRQRMERGPVSVRDAVGFAREIADGLDEASRQGIIHRDLKPSNIIITAQGHVKIMDFGLAKRLSGGDASEESAGTPDGVVVGTRDYMSPEQLRGAAMEPGSDLFAFGLILYETLAGVHPFKKAAAIDTQFAILNERTPDLNRHRPDAPADLCSLIHGLLEKAPADRPLMGEVRSQLAEISQSGRIQTEEPTMSAGTFLASFVTHRPRAVVAAGGVLVVALACLSLWLWLRKDEATPQATMTALVTWSSNEEQAALSPDGKRLSFISDRDGVRDIWLMDLPAGEPRRLTNGPGYLVSQTLSEDGAEVAYELELLGQSLFQTMRIDGGPPTRSLALPAKTTIRRMIRWVGDDVFMATEDWRLVKLSLTSGLLTRVETPFLKTNDFDVSPDGRVAAYSDGNPGGTRSLWILPFGQPPHAVTSSFRDGSPRLSGALGNGRLFFESDRSGQEDLWIMDRPGREPRQITFSSNREFIETVSIDGSTLIFRESLEGASLFSFDPTTGAQSQLTAENTRDVTPSLSNNGVLAWGRVPPSSSNPMELSTVVVGKLDEGKLSATRTVVRDGFAPLMSPDGRWLAYMSRSTSFTQPQMNLVELESGHTRDLGQMPVESRAYMDLPWSWTRRNACWSSQNVLFFVQAALASRSRIVRVDPGREPEVVVQLEPNETATHLVPSPDSGLVFVSSNDRDRSRSIYEVRQGRRTQLSSLGPGDLAILGFRGPALIAAHQQKPGGAMVLKSLTRGVVRELFRVDAVPFSWRLVSSLNAIAFSRRDAREVENLYLKDLESGKETAVTTNGIQGIAFSPVVESASGPLLFSRQLRNKDLGMIRFDRINGQR